MTDTTLTLNELMGEGVSFAAINVSAGDTTVVAAESGKVIRVHQLALQAVDDATVRFESGSAGGTALTGVMQIYAVATNTTATVAVSGNGGLLLPYSPAGWFWTVSGELLNLEVTGGDIDGVIGYSVRDA